MPINIEKDNSISISGFEGIGQSVLSDFSDMMGVNLEQPGVASVNTKFEEFMGTNKTRDIQTFTANADNDTITIGSSARFKDQLITRPFRVSTTGTLPAGLTAGTIYFAATDTNGTTFKVATSIKNIQDGAYVNITNAGSGTHTISFITMGKVIGWTYNSFGDIMALTTDINDDDIFVWQMQFASDFPVLVPGNTQSGAPKGIVNYKGYTLVFRSIGVDALLDRSGWSFNEPTWTNEFDDVTISVGGDYIKPFYSLSDDAIYFYNGETTRRSYKIGLLEEVAGQTFNPASGTTFDFVEDVVRIPFENNDAKPTTINELNEYLLIGTGGNKIYLWDKKSPSFTSFIELKDSKIFSIEVVDNMAYCITKEGVIYVTNLTSAQPLIKIPEHLKPFNNNNFVNIYTEVTAVEKYKEKLLIGTKIDKLGTFPNEKESLYVFELDTSNNRLTKFGITSLGEEIIRYSSNSLIQSIFVDKFSAYGDVIFLSTQYYNDLNGADTYKYTLDANFAVRSYNQGSARLIGYDNYEAYIITGLLSYGSSLNKQTLRNIEVNFLRPLTTGQGIKLSYRRNDNDAWTEWKTIDFTTYGAIKEFQVESPITDIKDLQIKINLKCYNGATSGSTFFSPTFTTPYLKSVRLIP